MNRTGQQRLDAILPAVARRDEFKQRVKDAEGDASRCADLMAEGIEMQREANGIGVVAKDGRKYVEIEAVCAAHCMFAAREAYLAACGAMTDDPLPPTPLS